MDMMTAIFAANKAKADLQASGQIGYTETAPVVVIPEGSYEFSDGQYEVDATQFPNAGDLITFTLDGVVYSGTGKEVSLEGMTVVYIGNSGAFGGADTGESYVCACIPAEGGFAVILLDGSSGTHTVELSFVSQTTHTIDPKYIPVGTVIDMDDILGADERGETPATSLDEARLKAFLESIEKRNLVFAFKTTGQSNTPESQVACSALTYLVTPLADGTGTVYSIYFADATGSVRHFVVGVYTDGSNAVVLTG